MTKTMKKKYLRTLNKHLKKEAGDSFKATFVFHPLGAKPKDATGVTASDFTDPDAIKTMDVVQARVFAAFGTR